MDMFRARNHGGEMRFVVAGGVAANTSIRDGLKTLCAAQGFCIYRTTSYILYG